MGILADSNLESGCGQVGGFALFKLLSEWFFLFFRVLAGERELRARIKDLIRYRKNGITKLAGNSMLLKVTSAIHVNDCCFIRWHVFKI